MSYAVQISSGRGRSRRHETMPAPREIIGPARRAATVSASNPVGRTCVRPVSGRRTRQRLFRDIDTSTGRGCLTDVLCPRTGHETTGHVAPAIGSTTCCPAHDLAIGFSNGVIAPTDGQIKVPSRSFHFFFVMRKPTRRGKRAMRNVSKTFPPPSPHRFVIQRRSRRV